MANKKKQASPATTVPTSRPSKVTLQGCQDLYEKAMLDAEADRWPGFKRHIGKAIKDAECLLSDMKQSNSPSSDIQDVKDFLAESCFEIGTYLLEEEQGEVAGDDHTPDGAKGAALARPHFERALELYNSEPDAFQAFARPTILALSEVYALLHMHNEDIDLCVAFLSRLTKQYNQWTPMQNEILVAMAQAFNRVGRLDDGEQAYKEIVSICKVNFGEEDERTVEAIEDLEQYLLEKDSGVCACQRGGAV